MSVSRVYKTALSGNHKTKAGIKLLKYSPGGQARSSHTQMGLVISGAFIYFPLLVPPAGTGASTAWGEVLVAPLPATSPSTIRLGLDEFE